MEPAQGESIQPDEYFDNKLLTSKIETDPKPLRCASIMGCDKKLSADELPLMYDKQLLKVLLQGTQSEVEAACCDARTANAQNRTGETVLMKACRHVMSAEGYTKTWLIKHLLEREADPLCCCDSGKNVMHDLFWSALPPPENVLEALEQTVVLLLKHAGREGVLKLMKSCDRFGFTPVSYITPESQSNWEPLVNSIFSWDNNNPSAAAAATIGSCKRAREPSVSSSEASFAELVTMEGGKTIDQIYESLNSDHVQLIKTLQESDASFLLSDMNDPDAIIVAASNAFYKITGYSNAEVLGHNCRLLQGPETDFSAVQMIRQGLREKTSMLVSILNYRKDKTTFLNDFALIPLFNKDRNLYFLGIQDCKPEIWDKYGSSCPPQLTKDLQQTQLNE